MRRQIAFYGSTPAYGDMLRLHGWGALHENLHRLSVEDSPERWDRMADLVDDEVLTAFSVVGTLPEVAAEVAERFGGDVDQVGVQPARGPRPRTCARPGPSAGHDRRRRAGVSAPPEITGTTQAAAWRERVLPRVEEVRPGLWSLPVPSRTARCATCYCYAFESARGLVLVDPGWPCAESWDALLEGLGALGAGPATCSVC